MSCPGGYTQILTTCLPWQSIDSANSSKFEIDQASQLLPIILLYVVEVVPKEYNKYRERCTNAVLQNFRKKKFWKFKILCMGKVFSLPGIEPHMCLKFKSVIYTVPDINLK